MKMSNTNGRLNRIEIFSEMNPCEVFSRRNFCPGVDKPEKWSMLEVLVGKPDKLLARYTDPLTAFKAFLEKNSDVSLIQSFIRKRVAESIDDWRSVMPNQDPEALTWRRHNYAMRNDDQVNREIIQYGKRLSDGQILYHGGCFPDELNRLDRPLSTSLSFVVSYIEGLQHAVRAGWSRFVVYVLKFRNPVSKAFVYDINDAEFGHEFEVVVGSGATFAERTSIYQSRTSVEYPRPREVNVDLELISIT